MRSSDVVECKRASIVCHCVVGAMEGFWFGLIGVRACVAIHRHVVAAAGNMCKWRWLPRLAGLGPAACHDITQAYHVKSQEMMMMLKATSALARRGRSRLALWGCAQHTVGAACAAVQQQQCAC
jgi:hypothetical protein